eukprot:TRINITY_DN2861_c0_g1_i1.p1 TRINITY_DN2861_c0_g1~~TRINITY_DN2861_c0_g1_i1.p1  ORF type:complete len:216 (+),score=54.30 TRINITY_DN2861_c0_g1_i1:67-714(+)
MPQNSSYTVDVQFKWGRLGEYGSKAAFNNGTHVLVEADSGIDMGMVIGCGEGATHGAKIIHREGTKEESEYWRTQLIEDESKARKQACKLLPENATNIRVLRCSYRFDKQHLLLQYECSGTPNHQAYLPKLEKHFSPCTVTIEEIPNLDAEVEEKTTTAPAPAAAKAEAVPPKSQESELVKYITKPGNFHSRGESIDSLLSSNGLSSVASEYDGY